jgi:hypothetical protein
MMQKENVSQEKTKDGLETYPAFVIQSRCIECELFVVCANVDREKKKEMKKQRRSNYKD